MMNSLFTMPELADGQLLTAALYGLIGSFHCIGMCGGIVLSIGTGGKSRLVPLLSYQAGRILCCTLIGVFVGALGAAVSLNPYFKALVPMVCAAYMLLVSLQLLGLRIPINSVGLPAKLQKKLSGRENSGPFLVGVLTGLIPCGILQSIQLYALGSGSALSGGFVMLLFALCSAPVPLLFGSLASLLSARWQRLVSVLSALFIIWSAVKMILKSLRLMGILG